MRERDSEGEREYREAEREGASLGDVVESEFECVRESQSVCV